MSIVVNGIIQTDAASIEAMRGALVTMQTASRTERGCREYAFSVDVEDPNLLRITECWDSLEALQAHFATEHMAAFRAAMADHPPRQTDITFFEASEMASPLR